VEEFHIGENDGGVSSLNCDFVVGFGFEGKSDGRKVKDCRDFTERKGKENEHRCLTRKYSKRGRINE
jgi:hypothetical protein